jgi:hypothetical protein
VPRASVAPPLAWPDSMRPVPAKRFQLISQLGLEVAIICSALRYAARAIDGIPGALGEFTTEAGGGADLVAAAICRPAGCRAAATMAGPDTSLPAAASTAAAVLATRGKAGVGGVTRRATPLTAQASTKEVIAATLNAELGVIRITHWRNVARRRWLNLHTAKALGGLHTKAGSSVCGIRR